MSWLLSQNDMHCLAFERVVHMQDGGINTVEVNQWSSSKSGLVIILLVQFVLYFCGYICGWYNHAIKPFMLALKRAAVWFSTFWTYNTLFAYCGCVRLASLGRPQSARVRSNSFDVNPGAHPGQPPVPCLWSGSLGVTWGACRHHARGWVWSFEQLLSGAHPSEHRGVDPGKLIERTHWLHKATQTDLGIALAQQYANYYAKWLCGVVVCDPVCKYYCRLKFNVHIMYPDWLKDSIHERHRTRVTAMYYQSIHCRQQLLCTGDRFKGQHAYTTW